MCACRCGIRVHLRDGAVRYIEGNPEHPLNKGVICAKGSKGQANQFGREVGTARRRVAIHCLNLPRTTRNAPY